MAFTRFDHFKVDSDIIAVLPPVDRSVGRLAAGAPNAFDARGIKCFYPPRTVQVEVSLPVIEVSI